MMRHSALRSSWAAALALMAVLVLAPQAGFAQAPQTINYQGSLTDPAGTPIDGTVDMTFRLYSDSGGVTLLWTEIHDVAVGNADAVTVTDGVFSVTLGAVTPLNLADFDNPVWLGITVGTDPEMTPLQAVDAVGYALQAKGAEAADTSDDLVCTSCVAEAELGFDTATQVELDAAVSTIGASLGSLSCTAGQIPAWNGTAWACAADADTDTVGALSCTAGQIPAWNGTAWACAADVDTDTDTDTLGALSCTANQIPKWNGTAWACAADIDTDTDTDSLGALTCTTDQIAKWNGTAWACAADVDTDTDTGLTGTTVRSVAGTVTASTTGTITAVCTGPGEVVLGGGWEATQAYVNVQSSYPATASTWSVVAQNTDISSTLDVTAYAICATP